MQTKTRVAAFIWGFVFAVVFCLCITSYFFNVRVEVATPTYFFEIASNSGGLEFILLDPHPGNGLGYWDAEFKLREPDSRNWHIAYYDSGSSQKFGHDFYEMGVSYWLILLLLAIPAAIVCWRRLRIRSQTGPVCPMCSYDMRATPDNCPECGFQFNTNEKPRT